MVFPSDVSKRVTGSSRVSSGETTKFFVILFIIMNIVVFIFTQGFWRSLGVPIFLVALVQLFLVGQVSIYLFRHFVFREQDRLKDIGSDTFSQYNKCVRYDFNVKYKGEKAPIFQAGSGVYFVALQLKFGANNEYLSEAARLHLEGLINFLERYNITCDIFLTRDNLKDSYLYDYLLDNVSKIPDNLFKIKKSNLEILKETMDFCELASKNEILTIFVKAKGEFQLSSFPEVLKYIESQTRKSDLPFRSYDLIGDKELFGFFRDFYSIPVIDLSLNKLKSESKIKGVSGSAVFRVVTTNNRSLQSETVPSLSTESVDL